MPAVRMVPIKDDEGAVIAQRFAASTSFMASLGKNYVEMKDSDGRVIRANKKIIQHYTDKGFELVEKARKEKT